MLRPQEGFDQRLISHELEISPEPALLRRVHDLTDACVSIARFESRADALIIESRVRLEHLAHDALALEASDAAIDAGRFAYEADEAPTLAPSIEARCEDTGEVEAWARRFVRPVGRTHVAGLLSEMTHAVRADFVYQLRRDGPPQTPAATLELRQGSCRIRGADDRRRALDRPRRTLLVRLHQLWLARRGAW